jgi:hypothetical protein
VARLNSDGTLDTSFGGGNGYVVADVGGNNDISYGMAVASDGTIYLAGSSNNGSNLDLALQSYTADGSLDTTFDRVDTLDGTPTFTEGGAPVVLDADVEVYDQELTEADNFDGASLTLVRNGGANAEDVFSATGTLAALSEGGNLVVGGTTIGTVTTNSAGTLVLTFNSNATNTLVNQAMQQIAYSNSSGTPPASAQIDWTFDDGNTGEQGTGGALQALGSTTVTIIATNEAPVLSGANDLTAIDEDDFTNDGSLVSDLLAGQVSDADSGTLEGIAVIAVDDTNGTWEYTTDGGSNWIAFGAVDTSTARLLAADANTSVRFVPDADWNGTVSNGITFHAWDQTSGTAGGTVDLTSTYTVRDEFGTAAYTNNDGSASWSGSWIETDGGGAGAGAGNIVVTGGELSIRGVGNSIAREVDLSNAVSATLTFDFHTGSGVEAADPDSVILEVSDDGGVTWALLEDFNYFDGANAGTRSYDISAYAAIDTQVRFTVNNGYGGPSEYFYVDNLQIEYQTSGGTGGATAFSTATASSGIIVNPIDDSAVISGDVSFSGNEGDAVAGDLNATDAEGLTDGSYFTVSADAANGTAAIDATTGAWTFTPTDPNWFGSDSFTVTVTDDLGGTTTQVVNITLAGVNDDPEITSDGGAATATINVAENTTAVTTVTSADVDGGTPTYSTSGGADQGLFSIDPNSGVLTFDVAPDYEGAGDNLYEVEVTVSDGAGGSDVQTISVRVTDVAEGVRVTPTSVVPLGDETLVNTETTDKQIIGANVSQAIATDANGNYVIVWASNLQDGSGWGVYAQLFNADGTPQGGEIPINTTLTDSQMNPTVAMDDAGNFVVAWQSENQDGSSYGVYTRSFDAAGNPTSAETLVNTETGSYQGSPGIAMAPNGDYVVIWTSSGQDNADGMNGIYAQLFNADGSTNGGEFPVNTYTAGHQQVSSVSMDANGNFVVTWGSQNQDGSNYGVFGQMYDANGVAYGSEFQVNTTTDYAQLYNDVVMLPDGRFIVAFHRFADPALRRRRHRDRR